MRNLLTIALALTLAACESATEPNATMTQAEANAFVRGFYESAFAFDEPPTPEGFQPGEPADWTSTSACAEGGTATFTGKVTINLEPPVPSMEIEGVIAAEGCTFTTDGVTTTFDADPGLPLNGTFRFAIVPDLSDFRVTVMLQSSGSFDWMIDGRSGSCDLETVLTADVSSEAAQSGESLGNAKGTICGLAIDMPVDPFDGSVPYVAGA